jgi:hypothetical protein
VLVLVLMKLLDMAQTVLPLLLLLLLLLLLVIDHSFCLRYLSCSVISEGAGCRC